MSEEQKEQKEDKKVVLSPEDCNAALDFWKHFNIPIPQGLSDAIDLFSANSTIENQDKIKLEICKAIATSDHEAFKDEMFSKIVTECETVAFDMQFDKDFEEKVTQD
jgi:hypothetical protein